MSSGDGFLPSLTVDEALQQARLAGIDRLDAHWLLSHITAQPRTWLLAHGEAALSASQRVAFEQGCARRSSGEPLAYIVGEKAFHGLQLAVDPRVLVPRPDTELLVDWAIALLAGTGVNAHRPRVIDLGTGSGAIALAVKRARPDVEMLATDASTAALQVARRNADRLSLAVSFANHDWWQGLDGRRFELVLANPPYIAEGDPHLPALRHEPQQALTSGPDGLTALREVIDGAADHLAPGGWLLLEHGHDQAGAVQALLARHGFSRIETRKDLSGLPRCTGGLGPATASCNTA